VETKGGDWLRQAVNHTLISAGLVSGVMKFRFYYAGIRVRDLRKSLDFYT